jgi:outer membrane protein TolC
VRDKGAWEIEPTRGKIKELKKNSLIINNRFYQMNQISIVIMTALWICCSSADVRAQSKSVALDSCYLWAQQNYPLVKQYALLEKSNSYSLQNIAKGYLPDVQLVGQASYQSDVTAIPVDIPGMDIPELSKDQYKVYLAFSQPVYDGGLIRQQKKLQEANAIVEKQNTRIQLYQIRGRVNQLFFGILLIDAQIRQNNLMQLDIRSARDKAKAAVVNGSALKSSVELLEADLLKAGQQSTELKANRKAFIEMLSLFINRPLSESTLFQKPDQPIASFDIKRPELLAFDYQTKVLNAQNELLTARNRPRLSFFAQGGFGKPALNMFSNNFDPYYLGGFKLIMPITGFYTLKNERRLIRINSEQIKVQQETFLFNIQLTLKQQNAEISKLLEIIKADEAIIPLRASIKNTALFQLNNGIINTRDYLREIHAEDVARQQKILHEIQLLQLQYNEQITTGN